MNRISKHTLSIVIFIVIMTIISKRVNAQVADTVLTNGQFYTLKPGNAWAETVAYKDGTIIYVGAMTGVNTHIGTETVIIDLYGRFAMPSFVEGHLHPLSTSYAHNFTAVLYDLYSHNDYIQAVSDFAQAHPTFEGIWGNGFATSIYGPYQPRKESLDSIDNQRPIAIISDDIHAMWVNSKALELAGITASTPNPAGGVIVKDPATGEPTGLLQEMPAMSLVWDIMSAPTKEEYKTSLLWGQQQLNRAGITTAHDAWMEFDPNYYEAYNELANQGLLTLRFRGSWYIDPNSQRGYMEEINYAQTLLQNFTHPHFQVNSFKFLADGTIEEGTALLAAPYSNQAGYYGIKNWTDSDMANAFTSVDNAGYQIHIHVIGDSAATFSLDALEQLGATQNRHSIAHIQLIKPEDVNRMGQLNASAHISHYWIVENETYWDVYLPALGYSRAKNTYPIKSMHNAGVNITVASDWPTTKPEPIKAIYNGMTRSDLGGGQLPPANEAASLEQMLQAATINGAYANFLENIVGTIEVGKKADIVVLSDNLFEIDTNEIPNVEVEMTFFEGRLVFDKNASVITNSGQNFIHNYSLKQNYPNPFNPSTIIKYTMKKSSYITLNIYNIAGQEIETLVNKFQAEGEYEINWQPQGLPSGLYFLKIQANEFSEKRKLILLK